MNLDNGQHLPFHLAIETDGSMSPPVTDDAITRFRNTRDQALWQQLKRLPHSNYAAWREKSPAQRRLMLDFAVATIKELEQVVSFMSRNQIVGEMRAEKVVL